ncbi:hypothetical protein Hbl1158_03955 [Halobaculum sp. CBA1158]|uniref:DUF7533 family protein n=1 Tax=Halobaculum sp. CBA1158 TaxID=2904243 RepID=UPI001F3F1829|nr:hypothetical protein [Halobaculum sp. CBA1158]UIP00524.1 hypothetical protein Hbl1158_03955 [Halobaculum sp. CBA1158]
MSLGILEQIGLGATLIFAIPVAVYGVQSILAGDELAGAAFLVVAALMVLLPRRLTTPDDVPATAAERAVGSIVGDPDSEPDPEESEQSQR